MPVTTPSIALCLFGRFTLTVGGQPLKIVSKKGKALLAYLALQPDHAASREKLATLLWGERPDRQARLSLRQCIMALRSSLAPDADHILLLEGDMVGLKTECIDIDAIEFNVLNQSHCSEDIENAVNLYRGEFLSELRTEADDFDNWLVTTRARFQTVAARALQACIDRYECVNDQARAIDKAERLVALDPLDEDFQRRLLTIYARYRGRETALAHAKALVDQIRNELDADLEPETRELIDDIDLRRIEQIAGPAIVAAHDAASAGLATPTPDLSETVPAATADNSAIIQAGGSLRRLARVARVGFIAVMVGGIFLTQDHFIAIGKVNDKVERPSGIVVLPFTSIDRGVGARLAQGISDDLINALSAFDSLAVISNKTSSQYRNSTMEVGAIADELDVRYAVNGNVRADGEMVRVNVELIDALSPMPVWSDHFEGDRASSAATDAIVRGIARSLQVQHDQHRRQARRAAAGWRF